MPRVCTVCAHPERNAIDKAMAGAANLRELSAAFRVSQDALTRHRDNHLPATLVKAQQEEDVGHAIAVVKQLKAINAACVSILAEARRAGDPDTALKAVDRILRQIELQAKLLGDLDERPTVNIIASPEWVEIRTTLLHALGPFPEARTAVAIALTEMDGARRN